MPTSIHERVRLAKAGKYPLVITRLKSGWVVANSQQPLQGYCLLLADPVVGSLNELTEAARAQYTLDMIRVGDALLETLGAYRINYETWCNQDAALHTHIVPRYRSEADELRVLPACRAYDFSKLRAFDPVMDAVFVEKVRKYLEPFC